MPDYRRPWVRGGTYFFTVTLAQRNGNDLLVRHIASLREAVRHTRKKYPFTIHAWVVLPDHMHFVISLPPDDCNFALRVGRIKANFSRSLPKAESISAVRQKRGNRGIWQMRYWEHLIRDEKDYAAHVDYVHINPRKHGLVDRVVEWPYSTFHRLVSMGVYPEDWAGSGDDELLYPD